MKTDSTSESQVGSSKPTEAEINSTAAVGMPPIGTPNGEHPSEEGGLQEKFRRMFAEAARLGEPQGGFAEAKAMQKALVEGNRPPDDEGPPEPAKTANPFRFNPNREQETVYVAIAYGCDVERCTVTFLWLSADKNRENVEEDCDRIAEMESRRGCGSYWGEYHLWAIPESLAYWIVDILNRNG